MLDRFRFSMPALIALILLVYFGLALFGKSFWPAFIVDTTFGQTLVNLTIAGCAYFLGTTQGSAKAHEVIAGCGAIARTVSLCEWFGDYLPTGAACSCH